MMICMWTRVDALKRFYFSPVLYEIGMHVEDGIVQVTIFRDFFVIEMYSSEKYGSELGISELSISIHAKHIN